ncbi:MAG: SAF domain-containing protein [Mycobacteriales bacterium]
MTTTQTSDRLSTRAARRASGHGGQLPPIGDRLPVPPRRRRPALAALAVVLILGGAALAATLVLSSGQKQEYLLVNRDIAIGDVLSPEDFRQQPLSATRSPVFAPVPVADFYGRVNGKRALVEMRKGSLLTQGTFGDRVTPAKGLSQLSLNVPEGQYPAGLQAGDVVKVLHTPRANTGSTAVDQGGKLVPRGATLVAAAYVTSVVRSSSGQNGVVVGIEVKNLELVESPDRGLPAAAAANALNAISVVRLDPTHEYDQGSR